jgi:methionyl-tRNA synthetase
MPDSKKQFTIATAIPYLNAKAHIGHALEYVFSDVIARYHKQQGEDVVAIMGADEHGQKIARSAEDSDVTPQAYVDSLVPQFLELHTALGVSYDRFVRTTDADHARIAQELWKKVQAAGFIDEREYEGLYCVGCEAFKTEAELVDGKCPDHLKEPEMIREKNYFFQLSKLQQPLLEWYDAHPEWIVPQSKMNEMRAFIERGLDDISISRDVSKMSWGVPVPDDDSQVMYVWFDALPNYLTGAGVTPEMIASGDVSGSRWPVDLINLGKDINRFHAILFAAMLIAADLPLPKQLGVHGFISVNGQKMSKSIGNVIDPMDLIATFGAEATRYLLMAEISFQSDGDISMEKLHDRYTADLSNGIGNLLSRTTTMVEKFCTQADECTCHIDEQTTHMFNKLVFTEAVEGSIMCMEQFDFHLAIQKIQHIIKICNETLEREKPWEVIKLQDSAFEARIGAALSALRFSLVGLEACAPLLQPFMPETAQKIIDTVHISDIQHITKAAPLFPRIELNK